MGTLKTMAVVLNEQMDLLEMHCIREIQRVDVKKNITPHTTWFSKADTSPVSLIFSPNSAF